MEAKYKKNKLIGMNLACGKAKIQLQFSAVTLVVYCTLKLERLHKAQLNSGTQQIEHYFLITFLNMFHSLLSCCKKLFQTEKGAKLFIFMHLS